MPTGLSIEFPGGGLKLINRGLARFSAGVHDLTPAFELMADAFARDMKEQFGTEGAHASRKWQALSPGYAMTKSVKFPGKPILQATGELYDSLTNTPLGVQQIGLQEAEFGTDISYATYHQDGTPHMPARPIVALNAKDRTEFVKILQAHLVALMKGALV